MKPEKLEVILVLLDQIDELAADSRNCYANARGNDRACYEITARIRTLLTDGVES